MIKKRGYAHPPFVPLSARGRLLFVVSVAVYAGAVLYACSRVAPPIGTDSLVVATRVVDGDTFVTGDGGKVRLIGVDTPESVSPDESKNVPFGKVAYEYAKTLIEGAEVSLVLDVQETDRYGRRLAYVYLEDGSMFNELLVKEGYARVMTVPPNVEHEADFVAAEEYAKANGLGVWRDYENIFPEG
jgi:endonuclease YncB( thermonuclease family)